MKTSNHKIMVNVIGMWELSWIVILQIWAIFNDFWIRKHTVDTRPKYHTFVYLKLSYLYIVEFYMH